MLIPLAGFYLGGLIVFIMWRLSDLEYTSFQWFDLLLIAGWPITVTWILYHLIKNNP
jgi:hypothetical protein